jgi:hypothetical protein
VIGDLDDAQAEPLSARVIEYAIDDPDRPSGEQQHSAGQVGWSVVDTTLADK